jgi:enamine deaminase RidA (YjgF/YER057c/UK114 family)
MTPEGILVDGLAEQTKLALDNIGHILEAAGVTFHHGT